MCEGLSISNFDKDTIKNYRKLDEKLKNLMNQYSRYKNLFEEPVEFPVNLKGRHEAVSSFIIAILLKSSVTRPACRW